MGTLRRESLLRIIYTCAALVLVAAMLLSQAGKVMAQEPPPQLPSSFYGEVHITDPAPVTGTVITVFRGTTQVASTQIGTYNSGLVYSVDVPGVASDQGTRLTFKLGDRVLANGNWQSGTNQKIDFHPPAPSVAGSASAVEGSPVTLTGSVTDWLETDTFTYSYNCDGGATYTSTATCTFPNNGTYTVGVKAVDGQGGEGFATASVNVENVVPTVTVPENAAISEGAVFTGSGSFTDPGADTWTATVDYGDGAGVQPLTLTGKTFSLSHTYVQDGQFTVAVVVTDKDGGTGTGTFTVTVNNVAPVVNAGEDAAINEGGTFNGSGSFTDPGADTWTATVDYGDGSGSQPLTLDGKAFALSHTYIRVGTFTVTVTVNDGKATGSDTAAVTVANVAPTATFTASSPVNEGSNITLSLSAVSDPGSSVETYTYAFDCGSGVFGEASSTSSVSCPTSDNGTLTVKGRVIDSNGGYTDYTATVIVNDVLPTEVSAGGPYTVNSGAALTLTGTYTCVSVDHCTTAWDLNGNGMFGEADDNPASHIWYTAGEHTVAFRVTDEDGNAVTANATVNVQAVTQGITLQPGWNLVSFNLHPQSTAPADVLSSINSHYDLVYAWNASSSWLRYDTIAESQDTLTELNETMGFWIHVTGTAPVTLTVTGSVPTTTSISLSGGWNLVGYPAATSRSLPGALLSGTDYTLVYAYHANDAADPWKIYDPASPAWSNDLTQLDAGWGYWVKVSGTHTWTVTYP